MDRATSDYTSKIKKKILHMGAALVGIADIESLKDLETNPPDLLDSFTRAISIAVRLPAYVFDMIEGQPTPIYSSVYMTANRILDEIAFKTALILQSQGYSSLPIPASQVLDKEKWHSAISHKAVARMAGIGWQGKSLLIITPEYGPRVRLTTLLATAPLEIDRPLRNRCGDCMLCRDACPVSAILGVNTEDHYRHRSEAIDLDKCAGKLTGEFAKIPEVNAPICGICIKACPFGSKPKKSRAKI